MSDTAAKRILDFADALPGPYGYERSIKISPTGAARNRFLVTFPAVALDMGIDLHALLKQLQCPLQAPVTALIEGRAILHLGIEQSDSATICKLYAEDADRVRELWDSPSLPAEPIPLHRSLKWQLGEPSWVATDYDWLPCETREQLMAHAQYCLPDAAPVLQQLVLLASAKCPVRNLQLLRVSEAGNSRLSLDFNVYDSAMTVSVLRDLSHRITSKDPYGGLLNSAAAKLENIADLTLGHIALGVGRDGERFVTIYYGVEERGGFS
ncbi:MAG: hypothetical protein CL693_02940 [Cellvibrionaceae bacterium]|nr:hypothetical protein [Cellvibrionaceae bacterium]|tara:strand:- start:1095 stop:1895 length:801 start_codon:yes stop_codon:yes gene_type:complete